MAFFTSWQTWAKLTFVSVTFRFATSLTLDISQVLGCAIVSLPFPTTRTFTNSRGQCLVLTYAVGVRCSNKRKLKKHTIRIAMEIAERGEMAEASRRSDEAPFGIRAIEKGRIVEGVWNSRATTPLQTPTSSKPSSPVLKAAKNTLKKHKRDSSLSAVSHVDIPEPTLVPPNSRVIVFRPPDAPMDKSGLTERNQIRGDMLEMDHEISLRSHMDDRSRLELYNDRPITEADGGLALSWSRLHVGSSWTDKGMLYLNPGGASPKANWHWERLSAERTPKKQANSESS
jgi:hypothetical protein